MPGPPSLHSFTGRTDPKDPMGRTGRKETGFHILLPSHNCIFKPGWKQGKKYWGEMGLFSYFKVLSH